jgi:uncharacterized protein YerC
MSIVHDEYSPLQRCFNFNGVSTSTVFQLQRCFNFNGVSTSTVFQLQRCFNFNGVSTSTVFQLQRCFNCNGVSTSTVFQLQRCFNCNGVSTSTVFQMCYVDTVEYTIMYYYVPAQYNHLPFVRQQSRGPHQRPLARFGRRHKPFAGFFRQGSDVGVNPVRQDEIGHVGKHFLFAGSGSHSSATATATATATA